MIGIDLRENNYFGQKKKWVQQQAHGTKSCKKERGFFHSPLSLLFFKWP
jgi:hypothetical protein